MGPYGESNVYLEGNEIVTQNRMIGRVYFKHSEIKGV